MDEYMGSFLTIDNRIREIYEEGANPVPILKIKDSPTGNDYYDEIENHSNQLECYW